MITKVLQWNARGLISKWALIKPFLMETKCDVLCIQESHFFPIDTYDFDLPNYTAYNVYATGERKHGGATVYVSNDLPHYQICLQSTLQAVACSLRLGNTKLSICSLYLPPTETLNYDDLDQLLNELPEPLLLCTDANSRHFLWGADRCDTRGLVWERVIEGYGLCVLNDGSPTRMDDCTGLDSIIDITLSSSSIKPCLTWMTDRDLHDSDHFPIYISMETGYQPPEDNDRFHGWNLNKAKWDGFRQDCELKFLEESGLDNCRIMTEVIVKAANDNIPHKTGRGKYICPWWTDECKNAIAVRKRALNRFRRNRDQPFLLLEYKKAKAKARQVIRRAKKDSWEKLLNTFNYQTPMTHLWDIIRKFTRKTRYNRPLPVLKIDGEVIDEPKAVGNVLGKYFSDISASSHYPELFQNHMTDLVNRLPEFDSDNCECYNQLFSLKELEESINLCGNTSVGPDRIHYAFIKHMTQPQMSELLKLYNYLWRESLFPREWTHSYVIPILKPGKPACNPQSYRPIQLTSCLGKVMERMIARRLAWYMDKNEILSKNQCAFRKGRSTTDHIVRLESEIRRGFFYNRYTLAVFLDFKSAYNLVFPPALLLKMYNLGFRGRIMHYLQLYLGQRKFQVKCRGLSDSYMQSNGLVQGGVISPMLFNLKINDIFEDLPPAFSCAMYADDCTLWVQGRNVRQIIHDMQQALDSLMDWTNRWGFTFTPSKCQAVIFSRYMKKRELDGVPQLTLNNEPVQYAESVRFLGVCLDSKLNMNEHVKYVKTRALQRVPFLKCLAGKGCGADRTILIRVYKSLIRPILEYACPVLDGPDNHAVASLETVQNACLRVATGASGHPGSFLCKLMQMFHLSI